MHYTHTGTIRNMCVPPSPSVGHLAGLPREEEEEEGLFKVNAEEEEDYSKLGVEEEEGFIDNHI